MEKLDFDDKRGSGGIQRDFDEKSCKMHERVDILNNKLRKCMGGVAKLKGYREANLKNSREGLQKESGKQVKSAGGREYPFGGESLNIL